MATGNKAGALRSLREMFPSFDEVVLDAVYDSNGGNVDKTIDCLLVMQSDSERDTQRISRGAPPQSQSRGPQRIAPAGQDLLSFSNATAGAYQQSSMPPLQPTVAHPTHPNAQIQYGYPPAYGYRPGYATTPAVGYGSAPPPSATYGQMSAHPPKPQSGSAAVKSIGYPQIPTGYSGSISAYPTVPSAAPAVPHGTGTVAGGAGLPRSDGYSSAPAAPPRPPPISPQHDAHAATQQQREREERAMRYRERVDQLSRDAERERGMCGPCILCRVSFIFLCG